MRIASESKVRNHTEISEEFIVSVSVFHGWYGRSLRPSFDENADSPVFHTMMKTTGVCSRIPKDRHRTGGCDSWT